MRRPLRLLVFTIFCLALTANLYSQSSAKVTGLVVDQNGASVAGAVVTFRGKVTHSSVTDERGKFEIQNIPTGDHTIIVSAPGFNERVISVELRDPELRVAVTLEIGSPHFSVTAEIGQEHEKQNLPQAVNLIGTEAIRQRTTTVLAQAAEEEVGVSTQRTSPTMGGFFIRGLVGAKVNVYVDGVRYTTSAQRGGVSTFFNLNEPTALQSIEILRGSSSAQYGSDALGGTVGLQTRTPAFGDKLELHGELNINFDSSTNGFGGSSLISFGTNKLGGFVNLAGKRVNTLRAAGGIDTHSAYTRFLGLPSNVLGDTRLPDTAFTQYGGSFKLYYSPSDDQQFVFSYSRSQQDGGRRYDQLLGGDGNLIADLRNLMLDFGYLRYVKQNVLGFDSASFTVSFNSQREERVNQGGQGDPLGMITHQYERTTATGLSFFLDRSLPFGNTLVIGGDLHHEKVNSPAHSFNPRTNVSARSRPRIPDEARYLLGGVYVQNAWQAISDRLRVIGALRYNDGDYRVNASDSPVVGGFRLWGDDSLRVRDLSGRIGAVLRVFDEFRIAGNFSRGFRAPSITDLGTLGLTGDGFEVDHISASSLGGEIGTTADASAVGTGLPVSRQRSEITNSYDVSARFRKGRFETEATFFYIDFADAITKQTLILPQGAVGQFLGDQQIIDQNANGAVFVALTTSPVLVRANFTGARIYGFEYEAEAFLTRELKFTGNYTFVRAEDKRDGRPPSIEGGTPPPTSFLSLRYDPIGKPFWIEFYSTIAAEQDRLSSLDLSDRRTGATRTRSQIQNFFRRGACVRGLTNNPDGLCGTGDETILIPTGETLAQVQDRVLGVGVNSRPLFTSLPSYTIASLRGGIKIGEQQQINWAFENIFDRKYRNPSWGIDGAGRSLQASYRIKF